MEQHTIALAGMSNEQIDAFRTALKICAAAGWTLVDGVQADLLVVDIDGPEQPFERLRAHLGQARRIAVFTDRADVPDHGLVLKKPLYSNKLKTLLDRVDEQMMRACTDLSAAAESRPERPDGSPDITSGSAGAPAPARAGTLAAGEGDDPDAGRSTVGARLLAGDVPGPLRVELGSIELLLDPDNDSYHAAAATKPLRALLELPFEAAQPLDAEAVEQMRGTPALPMIRLRWFAALCGMPGPSTAAVDPRAAYRLARWPQIEREFPQHFRIAKAMLKCAGTPQDIATAAGTAVEDVVAFIRAYGITGHVAVANPTSGPGTGPAAEPMPSKWRQTLNRTLRPATSHPQATQQAPARRVLDLPMFG
jgi:hypothetical protein